MHHQRPGSNSWYTCNAKASAGANRCAAKPIRQDELNKVVLDALLERVLQPERLKVLLEQVLERSDEADARRKVELDRVRRERVIAERRMRRLYELVEEGLASARDALFAERLAQQRTVIAQLETSERSLSGQLASGKRRIDEATVDRFGATIRERITSGNETLRKGYVKLFVSEVTVSNQAITISGTRAAIEAALDHGERSGAPSVPSFDRSWCPNPGGDYGMAFNTDFTLRFLDRMGVGRAILVGNSSGGRVAWHVAAAAPERVERLVLLAAGGYPRTTPLPLGLRIAMSPWLGPVMARILPRSAVEKGLRNTYGDPSRVTDEQVDRNYEITLRAGNRRALGPTLRAQEQDASALIRTVVAPTLILWGDRDTVVPPADAERFQRDIAGSRLVILPGVGHLVQEEDPAASLAAFEAFLAAGV